MTDADSPYRLAPTTPRFICVACLQCSSATEATCGNCGNKMKALDVPEVSDFVCDEAKRRVMIVVKRQAMFAGAFALPLFFYLLLLTTVGQTLTYLLPMFLFIGLCVIHPYIFKRDARIGRKYRRNPDGLVEALDVLGTRMQ